MLQLRFWLDYILTKYVQYVMCIKNYQDVLFVFTFYLSFLVQGEAHDKPKANRIQ